MAILIEMKEPDWSAWLDSRPPEIRRMAEKWPPNRLYRMGDTGHRVTIVSYGEDGTVRVFVSGKYNFVTFEREVFGVDPATLTECDLPPSDEPVGSLDAVPEQDGGS